MSPSEPGKNFKLLGIGCPLLVNLGTAILRIFSSRILKRNYQSPFSNPKNNRGFYVTGSCFSQTGFNLTQTNRHSELRNAFKNNLLFLHPPHYTSLLSTYYLLSAVLGQDKKAVFYICPVEAIDNKKMNKLTDKANSLGNQVVVKAVKIHHKGR